MLGQAKNQDTLNHMLARIEAGISAGQLQAAATDLNRLAPFYPNDARIYITGWLLARAANNPERAQVSAERAVELEPESMTARYCLASSLLANGKTAAASEHIERAVKHYPTNLPYLLLAAAVALALNDWATAERHARTALGQSPLTPAQRQQLADLLHRLGLKDEAISLLQQALADDPQDHHAAYRLSLFFHARDDREAASGYIQQALALQPEDPRYQYFARFFAGETPRNQPLQMNRAMFDDYAATFDAHLLGQLQYRTPKLLSERILSLYPDRQLSILDLGCGTGLLGVYLGPIAGHFAGVDISQSMVEQASKHNIYNRFHLVDVGDALRETPAEQYEVITAADVFVYYGELAEIIANAHKVLRKGGHFMFSCESAPEEGPDLVLGKSLRYAHNPRETRALLEKAGFINIEFENIDLRLEADQPVAGFIAYAQKPQ